MKTILTFGFLTFFSVGFSQSNFWKSDKKKYRTIGEQTTLTFNSRGTLTIPINDNVAKGITETLVASLLPAFIDLGFKISNSAIEKNLKKFTSEFTAKNTYMDSINYIKGFHIERKIILKKNNKIKNKTKAFHMNFKPIKVNKNTFVFALDSISVAYSGAKTKKSHNINDYIIEIKVAYYDGSEKKEQTSSPISLNLFKLGDDKNESLYTLVKADTTYLYVSDKFPINVDFTISEVSVKVIESNTAKVKAEKIKSISDKYSEDAKETAKTIINFYIKKSED